MSEADLTTTDALAQSSFLIQGLVERRAGDAGLSLIQTRLLGILRDREPTINELARLLDLEKSSVSGLVDRAEKRGLVSRRRSERDGRSVIVGLSEEGRGIVQSFAARVEEDLAGLLTPLEESARVQLTNLLTRVLVGEAARRGVNLRPET